ncbi:hypothetical protein ACVWY2_005208 [Bradyrhizobium sp. JR6.1]
MRLADLAQIRRADLLAGLDDELGVEAELAAARLLHRAQRGHVDRMLALVVGGAAAVDAVALDRGLPRIEPVAPFADHAVDDVTMAVGQYGRPRGIFLVVGEQIGPAAGRRFDQPGLEIELGEGGLQILDQIGAQRIGLVGVQALGLVADPAVQLLQELSRLKMLSHLCDCVGPCRHDCSFVRSRLGMIPPERDALRPDHASGGRQPIGIGAPPEGCESRRGPCQNVGSRNKVDAGRPASDRAAFEAALKVRPRFRQ